MVLGARGNFGWVLLCQYLLAWVSLPKQVMPCATKPALALSFLPRRSLALISFVPRGRRWEIRDCLLPWAVLEALGTLSLHSQRERNVELQLTHPMLCQLLSSLSIKKQASQALRVSPCHIMLKTEPLFTQMAYAAYALPLNSFQRQIPSTNGTTPQTWNKTWLYMALLSTFIAKQLTNISRKTARSQSASGTRLNIKTWLWSAPDLRTQVQLVLFFKDWIMLYAQDVH